MIIRSLSGAIRRQDWFAVLVEFLILVIGIFAALQVNNWNESRLDRVREQANLERLLGEAEEAVAYISEALDQGKSFVDAQHEMLELVFSDSQIPEDTSNQTWGLRSLMFYPAMSPAKSAYDELTASGGIQLIESVSVRESIADYYAYLEWYQKQLEYFRDNLITAEANPKIAARAYVRSDYAPGEELGRIQVVDWAGLREDENFKTVAVDTLRNQITKNANRRGLLETAQAMCDLIAAELNRKCEPRQAGSDQEPH